MTDYVVRYFDRDCLVSAVDEDEARRKAADVLHPRQPALLVVHVSKTQRTPSQASQEKAA